MQYNILILPEKRNITAPAGANLLDVLRKEKIFPDAPCGGTGRCGKCKVLVDGREVLACQMEVSGHITVTVPTAGEAKILTAAAVADVAEPGMDGYLLAFDIGTTTVAGYLLDGQNGRELAWESARNPQAAFGADVIGRIRHALHGHMEELTGAIVECVEQMAMALCRKAGVQPSRVTRISLVGNPAMQQLFLGIRPDNLAQIPFAPVLKTAEMVKAGDHLSQFENAELLIVPNISGFVGADALAGVLATGMDRREELTLLVDIGTNGEMVLGNRHGMVACATAAGPALEGANIQFGMCAREGAIDHVWIENGKLHHSVIGGGKAVGICGSGLIDGVAVALELGLLNQRGRILSGDRRIHLTDEIYLTQEDIRQVQLAKGAIAAGIRLMARHLGAELGQIQRVYLAGAFGTYMRRASACRIGLLPAELEEKIEAVGNAAGNGAKIMVCSNEEFVRSQQLAGWIQTIELADLKAFPKTFAQCMRF